MIKVKGVARSFDGVQVLDKINFYIEEGSFFGIIGEDDAGKTTLLRILMGFDKDYEGQVTLFGETVEKWTDEMRKWVRYVPDDILWEDYLSAEAYLKIAQEACKDYDFALEKQLCEDFSIPTELELTQMTYNENKLVQIIAAICARPKILILDEPINFLNKKSYERLLDYLKKCKEAGMTIIVAAEQFSHVQGYVDYFVFLKEGKRMVFKKVPTPDIRKKVITVTGGKQEFLASDAAKEAGICYLGEKNNKRFFSFKGQQKALLELLLKVEADDIVMEEMTLEEELEKDYTRWI